MSRIEYTPELESWLRATIPGRSTREILRLQNKAFPKAPMNEMQLKNFKHTRRVASGMPSGTPGGQPTKTYPAEVMEYIERHHAGTGYAEMVERLNGRFGTSYRLNQIRAYYKNHGFRSGVDTRFKPGHTPPNKGRKLILTPEQKATCFKRGHRPYNTNAVGTVVKRRDGYLWQKTGVGRRDWAALHRLIWERENGPVPKGCVLTFLDGNKENVQPDNLMLISKAANHLLNVRHLRGEDPGYNRTKAIISELEVITRKRGRNGNETRKT